MKDEEYMKMKFEEGEFRIGKTKLPWEKMDIIKNPKKFHKVVSYIKSIIRLVACGFGIFLRFDIAFFILGVAELLGIIEEIKE
jgi:hypothetical protein